MIPSSSLGCRPAMLRVAASRSWSLLSARQTRAAAPLSGGFGDFTGSKHLRGGLSSTPVVPVAAQLVEEGNYSVLKGGQHGYFALGPKGPKIRPLGPNTRTDRSQARSKHSKQPIFMTKMPRISLKSTFWCLLYHSRRFCTTSSYSRPLTFFCLWTLMTSPLCLKAR